MEVVTSTAEKTPIAATGLYVMYPRVSLPDAHVKDKLTTSWITGRVLDVLVGELFNLTLAS
jgi:hypothetical protein